MPKATLAELIAATDATPAPDRVPGALSSITEAAERDTMKEPGRQACKDALTALDTARVPMPDAATVSGGVMSLGWDGVYGTASYRAVPVGMAGLPPPRVTVSVTTSFETHEEAAVALGGMMAAAGM